MTRRQTLPKWALIVAVLNAVAILVACSGTPQGSVSTTTVAPTNTPAPSQPTVTPVASAPTTEAVPPTPADTAPSDPTAAPSASGNAPMRFTLVPEGSEARYRVREQLARLSFPSDAVGTTKALSGQIVVNPDGTIVSEESRIVVDLTTLRSDESRRDNYIKTNTLQTSRFPTAEFVPKEIRGLPSPLPTSGEGQFQLIGDLTLHGVTRQVTWEVTARLDGQTLTGSAITSFTFADFNLTVPQVFVVLSVDETIRLEVDFQFVRS